MLNFLIALCILWLIAFIGVAIFASTSLSDIATSIDISRQDSSAVRIKFRWLAELYPVAPRNWELNTYTARYIKGKLYTTVYFGFIDTIKYTRWRKDIETAQFNTRKKDVEEMLLSDLHADIERYMKNELLRRYDKADVREKSRPEHQAAPHQS